MGSTEATTQEKVDKLIKEAIKLDERSKFQDGLEKIKEAIALDGSNTKALCLAASFHITLGTEEDDSEARTYYLKCIELEPNCGSDKYLGLAEISKGKDSIKHYEKAIDLLRNEIEKLNTSNPYEFYGVPNDNTMNTKVKVLSQAKEDLREMKWRIASVYASIIEIYLVDLAEEKDSFLKALELSKMANEEFKYDCELWALLAQIQIKMGDTEDAKVSAKKSVIYIMKSIKATAIESNDFREIEPERLVPLLEKIIELTLTLKLFRLSKLCLEEMREHTAEEDPRLSSKYAIYHRLKVIHHLKGVNFYADKTIQIVGHKEKAREADEDDIKYKAVCKEIIEKTPTTIQFLKTDDLINYKVKDPKEEKKKNGESSNNDGGENENSEEIESDFEDSDVEEDAFEDDDEDMEVEDMTMESAEDEEEEEEEADNDNDGQSSPELGNQNVEQGNSESSEAEEEEEDDDSDDEELAGSEEKAAA